MITLRLTRKLFREDGIFSWLSLDDGRQLATTLEHSYANGEFYLPKIPNGTYVCVRGTHKLGIDGEPFDTFEITGVEGHTGLLFHCGNFDNDSRGCVLLGDGLGQQGSQEMVTHSRDAFKRFMETLGDAQTFPLVVVG